MNKLKLIYVIGTLVISLGAANVHAGDAAAGEAIYSSMGCMACHGPGGNSMVPAFPALAGLDEEFLANQLRGFRSGEVAGTTMQPMASALTDEHIDNLATYLAAQ